MYKSTQKGFTLIEMLISVTIMVLLIGGGIAGYISFNDKRVVLSAVGELKAELASAQSLANSGRLGGCNKLNGYIVSSSISGDDTILNVDADCLADGDDPDSPDGSQAYSTELKGIIVGSDISSDINILYVVLNGSICLNIDLDGNCAVPNPTDIVITVKNSNGNAGVYAFSINEGGQISEGDWQ